MDKREMVENIDSRFEEMSMLFDNELESWFNADTFYCEGCSEEFIQKWPGIYNRDLDFQRNTITLDSFYQGTRLIDSFTQEEFRYLVKQLSCPHCGGPITEFFSPYELKFEVPANFETNVEELANLAKRTPFLLLNHPFAQSVFDEVHLLSKQISLKCLPVPLFRARKYDPKYNFSSTDFMAPKAEIITEGRYNHAGNQVYYLAEDPVTCLYEMRIPNEGIMLGRIEVTEPLKVLDLMDEQLTENSIIQAIQWSSLLSSPAEGTGWNKPHYVFTRFVADVARSAGFDAIRYPSVRFREGFNYVLLDYKKVSSSISILDFRYVPKEEIIM